MMRDGFPESARGRCLCVFSRILGWSVFGRFVDEGMRALELAVEVDRLDYDDSAFDVKIPWYRNLSAATRARFRLDRRIAEMGVDGRDYDAFVVQGHQLAAPFRKFRGAAFRIITDVTPAITNARERGKLDPRSALKRLWCGLQDAFVYKPFFSRVESFLVLSDYVRDSLVRDYAIPPERIFTIGIPIFDAIDAMEKPKKQERPIILFVGNDFRRKGGDFLLDMYRRRLKDLADLWVVSSHAPPGISGVDGITTFSNLPHSSVLKLMQQSHLFVFPSYHDELGLVLAEAACAGLPIVARETGGQSEYVHHGENGFLLSPDQDESAWEHAIRSVLEDPALLSAFSRHSVEIGRAKCTRAHFGRQLRRFLGDLVREPRLQSG